MRDRFRNNLKFLAEKMPDIRHDIIEQLYIAVPNDCHEVFISLMRDWPNTRLRGSNETILKLKRKRNRVLISIARKMLEGKYTDSLEGNFPASIIDCDAIVSRCVHTVTFYSGNIAYSRIKTPIARCPKCSCADSTYKTRTKDLHCCTYCNITFWQKN